MRLIPVRENPRDFADLPELLSSPKNTSDDLKGENQAQKDGAVSVMGAMTFSFWLGTCILVSALAFTEFSSLWMKHLEALLPINVAHVLVPVLREVGSVIETVLRILHLDTL